MTTARDKFYYTRTLCCLLKALEGEETEIELRNESHVKGSVESVTAAMNVTMRNCELTVNGRSKQLQRLLVQGRKIRMVIIPDHIDMIDAMQRVVNMYNLTAKGRNEFKKTPTAKQRGRGHARGGLRGRGRARGGGRGRGDGGGGRGRGRSVPHQKTGGVGRQAPNISGDSFGTGAIAADSSSTRGFGAHRFGKHTQHSIGSSSRTESSMLRPQYMKHASDDLVNPCHQEVSPSAHVGETAIQHRTDDGTPLWPQDSSDHTSAVQCPAISSTARSGATVIPDLRHKLHHLQHPDTDRRHSSKSSEKRHTESSRSPDRWSHTESDHCQKASGSDTESGKASEKHRQVKREDKDSYSRHDRKSWSRDRNRLRTSQHSSPSAVRQHSPSQRHPSSRDSRPSNSQCPDDSDSWTRRHSDSDRQRVEGGDRLGKRQRDQKSAERSTSSPSHSGHRRDSRRDSHSEHSGKQSSQRKPSSGD